MKSPIPFPPPSPLANKLNFHSRHFFFNEFNVPFIASLFDIASLPGNFGDWPYCTVLFSTFILNSFLKVFLPKGQVSLSTRRFSTLLYYTVILQRIRIIEEDAGFEPWTSAPEVWCAIPATTSPVNSFYH